MLAGRTVLIVEDEFLIVNLLLDMVEDLGMVICDVVDTADLAVKTAVEAHPEIVLMDVRLRGVQDGIDAAHRIHEACACPVVFVTGSREPATVSRIEEAHPAATLFKPITPRVLRDTLENVLNH